MNNLPWVTCKQVMQASEVLRQNAPKQSNEVRRACQAVIKYLDAVFGDQEAVDRAIQKAKDEGKITTPEAERAARRLMKEDPLELDTLG